jgi:hypothetical protein
MRQATIRLRLKCDGTRAETRFRLSAKRTSPFKSPGASVQPTTGSWGVRMSGSNAGYTMFRGNVRSTGYPLHSKVSPSLPLICVTVCHHILTGLHLYFSLPILTYHRDSHSVDFREISNLEFLLKFVKIFRFSWNPENIKVQFII